MQCEQAYDEIYMKPNMGYNNDVKEKLMYSDNPMTKKHCQHYENQYILYKENYNAHIDSPVSAANFINNWVNKGGSKGSV
eukprot:1780648-Ditylum_brightwellii.AAC.1